MSQLQDTLKAGSIQVQEGKKGLEFFAFNHERGKPLHVGTLSGLTYEKTAPLLRKPEPSFCLPTSELAAIEHYGGQFIRFVARGSIGTYAISLEDYKRHAEKYYNAAYGYQMRCSLKWLSYSPKVSKRNPIVDNPPVATSQPVIRDRQLSLFGAGK
jgi:hypothetical protein